MTNLKSLDMEYFKRIAQRVKHERENPPAQQKPKITPVVINQNNNCWNIQGVWYNGNDGDVDIFKNLLENGECRTQDSWLSYSELAKRNGKFYTPDFHLLYGTLQRAFFYKNEPPYEDEIEELRSFIQNTSRLRSIMTLTKVRYLPDPGGDIIIHNQYMTDRCFTYSENVVGESGLVLGINSKRLVKGLVGESDVMTINQVSEWFNKTPAVINRLNSKPNATVEGVGTLSTSIHSTRLYFDGDPNVTYPSLGFRFNKSQNWKSS